MNTTIIKSIGCGILLFGMSGCADYLEKESFDIITPEQVWEDPKLINAVMVNLYDGMVLEDFNYWFKDAWRLQNPSSMSDEAQASFQKTPCWDNGNATYTYEDDLFEQKFSDRYKNIRNCNDFISQLNEATSLSDDEKKLLLAETRFIRAMHYFTLVKRYGGVPIISEPQEYDANNLEALMVPRNKEVEVYDTEITSTQATMESSMPETSPLLPLNAGSSSSGFPAMYDSAMLMATIGYFVGSESSLQNHRVRVAYVDEEVDPSSTEMTLYLRHDRGSDEGTTYTNYFYGGINVSTAVQSFRAKTGNYPTRIVLKAKESQAATTVLPSTYTNYTVTYKAPSE